MSSSNKEVTLYELAGFAKEAAEMLQQRMSSSNEALAASACLEDLFFLKRCVNLLEERSRYQAAKSWTELVDFLDIHATWPRQMFWSHFEKKLKAVGEASVKFRETCFFRSEENGCTIFHLVCQLNPPVKVVRTLIDVIPLNKGEYCSQYNHLSCSYTSGDDCRYPLHMVMKHGGSLDLVKLLVEADKEKTTLETFNSCDRKINTLLHVLISNRTNHKPQTFSAILHYLILNLKIKTHNSELHKVNESNDIPAVMLYDTLKKEGLTLTEIFDNTDFKFLLQATCYHEICKEGRRQKASEEFDDQCRDIEGIPVDYAFLVCSCCFVKKTVIEVLEHFFSRDSRFLLNEDMHGIYPIMGMIDDGFGRKYCVDAYAARRAEPRYDDFKVFIVSEILRLAPECARHTNKQGLFPLHVVADRQRLRYKSDESRLELLHIIWKADPDVASIMDKELNLPPFALPERYVKGSCGNIEEDEDDYRCESRKYTGLSSTYFLLRQQPEMIAETIAMMQKESKEVAEPSPKRIKQG